MSYMDELNFWLNDDYFDQKTKDELLAIRNNEAEVEDRFYKELEFGTGGLRGVFLKPSRSFLSLSQGSSFRKRRDASKVAPPQHSTE